LRDGIMPTAIAASITPVSARTSWRALLFVTASLIALAAAPPPAAADDECGPPVAGVVTCPVDAVGPDYPDGITYNAAEDLAINVDDGVSVIGTAGVALTNSAGNGAVAAPGVTLESDADGIVVDNTGDGSASIDAAGAITAAGTLGLSASTAGAGDANAAFGLGTLTMSGAGATGVLANATGAGNANASSAGDIIIQAGGNGVRATAQTGAAQADSTGTVSIVGGAGAGVSALSAEGAATANGAAVTTEGDGADGVLAQAPMGDASATASGAVSTNGAGSRGVVAESELGLATASAADVTTLGESSIGVLATSVENNASASASGAVSTQGATSSGIVASSELGTADASGASVSTVGETSDGVIATSLEGDASATATGDVSTEGATSRGVVAASDTGGATASAANVTTLGADSIGVAAVSTDGAASASSSGLVDTTGANSIGVSANSATGDATANALDVTTLGENALGVQAISTDGAASATATGNVSTAGLGAFGVHATTAGAGDATASAAFVTTTGESAIGVLASSIDGIALASASGDVNTSGLAAIGVSASSTTGEAIANATNVTTAGEGAIGVQAASEEGPASSNVTGAVSTSGAGASGIVVASPIGPVVVTANSVATTGEDALGISATSTEGSVDVSATGAISTSGANAGGVLAVSSIGPVTANVADVATLGDNSVAVFAQSDEGSVNVASAGALTAEGIGSHGIVAVSAGPVTVDAGDITATGEGASGVIAISTGDIVDVTVSGNVQGGWVALADPPVVAPTTPIPEGPLPFAAGVVFASGGEGGTATLTNNGEIGALSDTAILGYGPSIIVNNAGTVTGEVFLFGDEVTFNNTSSLSFDVRNFADGDGDGVRETEGVSISDFGGAGVFNNDAGGVVNLANVTGATIFDATGELPLEYVDPADYDIAQEGVEQGQLTNLATFNHAGSIVLQDELTGGTGPVAGDVLAIIGGEAGPANFVSNGGSLSLDTVLDAGGAEASLSDMLILDTVTLGTGATQVFIANAGGEGAQTVDNGILLVDVLDPEASAAGAFELGETTIAGAWQYELFQGGVGEAALDGNWYLRSDLSPTTDFYRTVPASMLRFGRESIGSLQRRVGNRWWRVPERQVERVVTDPAPPPPPAASCPQADFVVYFEWDRSDLNGAAQETIDAALNRARQCSLSGVTVIGHTDTSGSAEYNVGLSERRSSVVRDALVARGAPAAAIQTEARGETDLAQATPDGVREPLNRRAAVTIRVGAPTTAAGPPPAPRTRTVTDTIPATVNIQGQGVWGRIQATDGEFESGDENTVSVEENTWLAQAGFDFLVSQDENGTIIGSVFGQYGELDTDVRNADFGDIGALESSGWGFGGGVTWYSPGGAYADGQMTFNWLDSDLNSDALGDLSGDGIDGTVWALSIEGGYRYETSPNYYVVPQAQLIYADAEFDDFTDPFGADVSVDDGDSMVGRLGVAIEYQDLPTADGDVSRLHAYGIANLYYEFMGDTGVAVDGIDLQDNNDELWGEVAGGLTYLFDTNWSVYAEGGYLTSLENIGDSQVLRGSLGVRYNW
jgi:outer membrane autotransporter protein